MPLEQKQILRLSYEICICFLQYLLVAVVNWSDIPEMSIVLVFGTFSS
jgi:hypothetical protein